MDKISLIYIDYTLCSKQQEIKPTTQYLRLMGQ